MFLESLFVSIQFFVSEVKSCATERCPTPPGPEGSNGQQRVLCDAGKLDLFVFVTLSEGEGSECRPPETGTEITVRPGGVSRQVMNAGLTHMLPFIHFIIVTIVARLVGFIAYSEPAPSGYCFGRPVTLPRRVSAPRGVFPRYPGHVPVRLEALLHL